ncbi:MAG: hypothetical protein J5986_11255 [Roseburia sp.]|nr:hypothetical protein [Roseburia sp.]
MKPDYFDLISPSPILLPGVGGVLSPTLKDISTLGIHTYHYYLSVLSMDVKTYFSMLPNPEPRTFPSEEELSRLSMFDLLTLQPSSAAFLAEILNFFLKEDVSFSGENGCFLVNAKEAYQTGNAATALTGTVPSKCCLENLPTGKITEPVGSNGSPEKQPTGRITRENYEALCSLICRRNNVRFQKEVPLSGVKSKKAREIMKKLKKGRAEKAKSGKKTDTSTELGNIISAVANRHPSLNPVNIWELTVFQLWDSFFRLSNNQIYNIESMSVAAWGNKDNHFDAAGWFKPLDLSNEDFF